MKISVITVTYNCENTLEETIKSIISQDHQDFEYLVIDGGSTDRTKSIIEKYRSYISYYISEKDNGISDAFNKGIRAATGDVIGIINADDILYPGALRKVAKAFYENPETDVLYGNSILFRENLGDGYIAKPNTDLSKLRITFQLIHASMFVSAEAYKKYGLFSLEYACAMDYELTSRMYYAGAKFLYLDEILSGFRNGGKSVRQFKITEQEHRQIALRNGASRLQIELYLKRVSAMRVILKILRRLHIEMILRKVIKKQNPFKERPEAV